MELQVRCSIELHWWELRQEVEVELSASRAALRVGAGGSEPTHSIIYELHKAGIWKVHVCSKFITIPHRKKGGIIRQYSEQIVCKQIRQPRMNTFLERHKLPKLTGVENLSRLIVRLNE